jgi:hypothetical protein
VHALLIVKTGIAMLVKALFPTLYTDYNIVSRISKII